MKRGFSLIELMLTLLIFSIVLSMIYPTFNSFTTTSKSQEDIMMLNQNLQACSNIIERTIRMAGFGAKYSIDYEGKSVNGYSSIFTTSDGGTNSGDSVTVILGNRIYGQVTSNLSGNTSYKSNTIYVTTTNVNLLDSSFKKYVFFDRNPFNKFFELSSAPTTLSGKTKLTLSSSNSVDVSSGDYVYTIRAVTFSYDSTDQEIETNENVGGNNQPIASWIEAFQIQYGIDEDGDGTFDDTDSDGDPLDNTIPSGKESYLKLVRISILGRAPHADAKYKDSNTSYVIANQTITLDNNDNNGIESTYDVHYRRKLLTINITPRNFLYETF